MKSERSQVQESNLLADKVEQKIAQLRPYLPILLGGIIAVLLGMLGYGFYSSQRETRAARAWTDFYFSDTQIQDLDAISSDFADTSAGQWARLTAGDRGMAQAMEKWNVDRAIADQRFQEAADDYREAVNKAGDAFVKSRALYGLAQALEGLGKRTEAVDQYRLITTLTGLSPEFLAEINQRIQWLESKGGEAFFTWYTEKRTTAPTTDLIPTLPNLPPMPNISFPPTTGANPAGDASASPSEPGVAPVPDAPASSVPDVPASSGGSAETPDKPS
jgi:tetratricopeptide (TPR) repeat protein